LEKNFFHLKCAHPALPILMTMPCDEMRAAFETLGQVKKKRLSLVDHPD
jgi:hypothetical protein